MSGRYTSAADTDPGAVRANNEDAIFASDEQGIYFVVDGMGGQAAGEEAARIAKDVLIKRLERRVDPPDQRIREAIALANNAIYEAAQKNPAWHGMGCVLTVVIVEGDEATIGHVGDSRLYKVTRSEGMQKITRDHSPVGVLEDNQTIDEAAAMADPRRNEVYRDVGTAQRGPYEPDFVDVSPPLKLGPDCALLLCSDGLTDALHTSEVKEVIFRNAGHPNKVVAELIRCQREVPGKDNVSVVYVEGSSFGRAVPQSRPREKFAARDIRELVPERRLPYGALLGFLLGIPVGVLLTFGVQHFTATELATAVDPMPTVQEKRGQVILVNPTDPAAKPTIAEAMAAAVAGDTIRLVPTIEYQEAIRLKDGVDLDGANAILRLRGSTGIIVESQAHVRITRLRIQAGPVLLTGIEASNSFVTLKEIEISGARDYAIRAVGEGHLSMEQCNIHDNAAGVFLGGTVESKLSGNSFVNNGKRGKLPCLRLDSTGIKVSMTDNDFRGNPISISVRPKASFQEFLNANTFDGVQPGDRRAVKMQVNP